jgi:isochorismate synthase
MTVVDRRAASTQVGIARAVTALLATSRPPGPRRLGTTTLVIAPLDPIDLFAAARALDLEAALWLQPAADRSIVGVGRAWAIEAAGPARFIEAADAWREVLADAVGMDGGPDDDDGDDGEGGPVLLGGLGFSGVKSEAGDPWASFGASSLVLPTFGVRRHGSSATLTVALAADRSDDPDPGEAQGAWEAITRAAEDQSKRSSATSDARDGADSTAGALRPIEERPDRPDWERTVGLFAGAVGRGRIDKVVLARRLVLHATADLDVVAALRHLARTAPESTTFAFTRDGTTFLGATPERLVRTHGRSFETVAIAGSAPRGDDAAEDARLAAGLLASEKDREEHAVVVDMLRASLGPIVETLHVADAPVVLPLRHLQHLETPITGTTRDETGLLALAGRLHPTPAVGGTPRDVALGLISEHETFDRGWYAGPVGWLGADGDGEMMVALRCGLVEGSLATLFAGCGIVADSDPAREWEESRLKLRTMLLALGGVRVDEP